MSEVSTIRLYILRAMYLFIVIGLGFMIWPLLFRPVEGAAHMSSVVRSVLAAVSLLALIGLRHPLKMLPLLFFELAWKVIWVLAYGLPLWRMGKLTPAMSTTLWECLVGVVLIPFVLPWGYVIRHYGRAAGDRCRPGDGLC
jgi:hypothetical protein